MKQFKLFVWIFVLVLLRTIISVYFNMRGIVPDVLFAFVIAHAAYERNLNYVIWVTLICGALMSAMSGAEFGIVMLIFMYSAAATYMTYAKSNRLPGTLRAALCAAVFTAVGECFSYMAAALTLRTEFLLSYVLPMVICNTIFAAVIYLLLKKCFDSHDIAGKLIIS